MAYISAKEVADIRARLKESFPLKAGWKFSVKLSSGNLGVDVHILRTPVALLAYHFDPYAQDAETPRTAGEARERNATVEQTTGGLNHHWFREHYAPKTVAVLERIIGIVLRDHWDESDSMTDYFNCAFYPHFGIGKDWRTPVEKASAEQVKEWHAMERARNKEREAKQMREQAELFMHD